MKSQGKLVIEGCKTPQDEERHDRRKAKDALKKCKDFEKNHKYERIPIFNGYRMKRID